MEAFGPDVIYSNTADSGYFSSLGLSGGTAPGSTNFDEGGIPTTTNTSGFAGMPDRDVYRVNGFQISYCDFNDPGTSGWEISFYESYVRCTLGTNPVGTVVSTGLPAAGDCWVVQIDLSGGMEFDLAGDGGDGFDDNPFEDSFGWSMHYAGSGTELAGWNLAGDPRFTDPGYQPGGYPLDGTSTYYGAMSLCNGLGTGYLTDDVLWVEDSVGSSTGCYFFGGYANLNGCGSQFYPYSSYHMEIYAEGEGGSGIGTSYCDAVPNSTGAATMLVASGSAAFADNNVRLVASNMASESLGLFLTSQTQGFVTNPGGSSGNLCVVGDVGRFAQPGSQVKISDAMGNIVMDTAMDDWSLQSIPQATPPFSYSASAGMTTHFQLWHRDLNGSNFSNGLSITWR